MSSYSSPSAVDIEPRGITIAQASKYVGLSESAFKVARERGIYPKPTLPGGRIDFILLKLAMDRLSGIHRNEPNDPLADWEARRHARSIKGHK